MNKRLQNIIREYEDIFLHDIWFNENRFEIEVDLCNAGLKTEDFLKNCNEIKERLEKKGYFCACDENYAENIYRIYIVI